MNINCNGDDIRSSSIAKGEPRTKEADELPLLEDVLFNARKQGAVAVAVQELKIDLRQALCR